jgi:hypothetical protein
MNPETGSDVKDFPIEAVFRIYGDNILECEHIIAWLKKESTSNFKFESQNGPIDRPVYVFTDPLLGGKKLAFQLCPYYGGTGTEMLWQNNPLTGTFDEKTDVVITQVLERGESQPIFAAEFVDALMAGNQGWQRSRRAINAAESKLTYLYVQPVIGWERDSAGLVLKNPRFLPATVCLAQLTLCSKFGIPSLQIYTPSDWSDYAMSQGYTLPRDYKRFGGLDNAITFTCHLIRSALDSSKYPKEMLRDIIAKIIKEMLSVAKTYSEFAESRLPVHANLTVLDPNNQEKVASIYAESIVEGRPVDGEYALHHISETEFKTHGCLFWKDAQKKTCSTRFRDEILAFLNWKSIMSVPYKLNYLRAWGIQVEARSSSEELDKVTASKKKYLPTTYKEGKSEATLVPNRKALRQIIQNAYPEIDETVLQWIHPSGNTESLPAIFLVPLYAYKPSGDSRPDRGLLPMLKALFPSIVRKDRTVVIVYSKHTPTEWKDLVASGRNELWNSISNIAGALIVDKTSDGILL